MQTASAGPNVTPGIGRRVVIAGGGYAGTTLAVKLAKGLKRGDDLEILLVEPNPCQQALSELDSWQWAPLGRTSASSGTPPCSRISRSRSATTAWTASVRTTIS